MSEPMESVQPTRSMPCGPQSTPSRSRNRLHYRRRYHDTPTRRILNHMPLGASPAVTVSLGACFCVLYQYPALCVLGTFEEQEGVPSMLYFEIFRSQDHCKERSSAQSSKHCKASNEGSQDKKDCSMYACERLTSRSEEDLYSEGQVVFTAEGHRCPSNILVGSGDKRNANPSTNFTSYSRRVHGHKKKEESDN